MVRRGVACDACTKCCETFHHKQKDLSPIVTRFFKVMVGEDYSKVLYLPPRFARTLKKRLASRETQIEDSSGKKWPVTLSYVEGSLAIRKGWNKFFLDHDLEKGQFLVFNYRKGSHFFVQIYDKSACEKVNFDNEAPRQKKRLRREPETFSLDEPFQSTDPNSTHKLNYATSVASESQFDKENAEFGRLQVIPTSMDIEDPIMVNRDDGYYQREDRNFLYDLSSFEMEKEKLDANKFEAALGMEVAPPCLPGIMEQTETKGDDAQLAVVHTNEIDALIHDIFADKCGEDLDTIMHPSHTMKMEQSNTKMDDTKTAGIYEEQTKTKGDDTQMGVVHADENNGHIRGIFADKYGKTLDSIMDISHTEIMEQSNNTKGDDTKPAAKNVNPNDGIFMDKFEKVPDTKIAPSHTEMIEQKKTKRDDTQMTMVHPKLIGGHSSDIFTDKFKIEPTDRSKLSMDMMEGINNVLQSNSESPSIGSSKIVGKEYAVKRSCESSVSSSALKDPFGKQAVKKELAELGVGPYGFPGVFSGDGKEAALVWKHDQISHPVVKVEPDLPYDIVPSVSVSPFSAEVKNQSYLELPVHIPSNPGRRERGRGKVVYLRDPSGRIWPLLYPELASVKALMSSNWTRFCQQFNITPGDECRFQVEDEKLCIYRVDVARRFAELPDK